ncbi:hypothetical protein L6452_27458 [Arctium lappa]|uniref:Uncharacterized protein n=1 Tax=Arctium lappa TaxID=4217 RepID=A0ACB8ZVB6_ARCLA|nr:hypothetical protein L6452_27458 [Arctium lappa]
METKKTRCLEPMIENFARENLSCIEENPNVSKPFRRLYECKDCNKRYDTFQALGGHRASHKKVKLNDGDESPSTSLPKLHECKICGDEFATGQALGGHMRRHQGGAKPENYSVDRYRPRRLKSEDEVEELSAMYPRQQTMEGDKYQQLQEDKNSNEVAEADNGVRVDKADDFWKQTARRGDEEFMCCDLNLAPDEDDEFQVPIYHEFLKPHDHPYTS